MLEILVGLRSNLVSLSVYGEMLSCYCTDYVAHVKDGMHTIQSEYCIYICHVYCHQRHMIHVSVAILCV